jgi:hypothetical protein
VASAVCAISPINLAWNAENVAHELGHALGLHHVWCADRPPPGPYSAFLPATTEEPGWYARNPDAGSLSGSVVPARRPEMMSYCQPRWPSVVAYNYIFHGRHV